MKGISAAIILMTIVAGSAAHAAIRCEDAPGREQRGVYWSWREIDGKRCWFIRTSGAMPAQVCVHVGEGGTRRERCAGSAGEDKNGADHSDAQS